MCMGDVMVDGITCTSLSLLMSFKSRVSSAVRCCRQANMEAVVLTSSYLLILPPLVEMMRCLRFAICGRKGMSQSSRCRSVR